MRFKATECASDFNVAVTLCAGGTAQDLSAKLDSNGRCRGDVSEHMRQAPIRQREWVRAYTRLRWKICSAKSREQVNGTVRYFRRRAGTKSGVYVLAKCRPEGRSRDIIRGILSGTIEVLYIGLSEGEKCHRAAQLSRGLTGGSLCHDAAKKLNGPYIKYNTDGELSIIICSYSPTYCLENFFIREYGRLTGYYPLLNEGPSTRSSTHMRKMPRRVSWNLLLHPWKG